MKKNILTKIMVYLGLLMVVLTMVLLVGHQFLPIKIIEVIPVVIALLLGLFGVYSAKGGVNPLM